MEDRERRPGYPDLIAWVQARDPLLVEASLEVDLTLLASSLRCSVRERLATASTLAHSLTELRRVASRER
jgi:hypothetical protein